MDVYNTPLYLTSEDMEALGAIASASGTTVGGILSDFVADLVGSMLSSGYEGESLAKGWFQKVQEVKR